jgi:hypothetical protein
MEENWKTRLKGDPLPWLLSSDPWTRYRTLKDLVPESEETSMEEAYREMIQNEAISRLAWETKDWMSVAPTRNNDAKISYFKLRILADFGINWTDMDLGKTVDKATEHVLENMFAVRGALPKKPGKGEKYEKPDPTADVWHISPCNSPAITAALL